MLQKTLVRSTSRAEKPFINAAVKALGSGGPNALGWERAQQHSPASRRQEAAHSPAGVSEPLEQWALR